MSPATGRFRSLAAYTATILLCSGLTTASAAATANAATTRAQTATAAAAPGSLTLASLGTRQTEPDTAVSYRVGYTDTDSVATVTLSATGLPPGLSIDPGTGIISGTTDSTIASYDVTVTATDSAGNTASASFTWNVWNSISVPALPPYEQSRVGVPAASLTISATDSAPGETLSYAASNLPDGLSIDPTTGVISGTPTGLASDLVTVTVTDGTGSSATAKFHWNVGGDITITGLPASAQALTAGRATEMPFAVHDNAAGDTLTDSALNLDPGLRVDWASGLIWGWPSSRAVSSTSPVPALVVEGLDGGAYTGQVRYSIAAPSNGRSGPVRLNLGGKCLDDTANSSANGTKVEIWTCNGGANQNWTYASDGSLRIHGKCLDVKGQSTAANAKLDLYTCNGGANQAWDIDTGAQLRGLQSGYCLTDPASSTVNGTQLEITGCGGYSLREWTLPAGPVESAVPGHCLDDFQAATANGAKVDSFTCNNNANQNWTFEPDGTIRVNGKCLDDNGDKATAGNKIDLWACNGSAAQEWTETGSSNFLGVQVQHGSLCLSPTAMAAANGTQLALEACGTDQSYWHSW